MSRLTHLKSGAYTSPASRITHFPSWTYWPSWHLYQLGKQAHPLAKLVLVQAQKAG
jgi:hypothetical protein